jgi:predicted DNA-binding transcriptional regulator AlpA
MNKPTWFVDDLAFVLGLEVSTVRRKVSDSPEELPPSAKVGRGHIWLPGVVLSWIEERTSKDQKRQPTQVQQPGHGLPQAPRGRGRPRKQPIASVGLGGAA